MRRLRAGPRPLRRSRAAPRRGERGIAGRRSRPSSTPPLRRCVPRPGRGWRPARRPRRPYRRGRRTRPP
ncbi:MAG TPA: hypothetical protein DEF51_26480 [Myxococcales bacterium]|nr:hypothetical protein [Myxococcales bacterium]